MASGGFRAVVLVAFLAGTCAGCRGFPSRPEGAAARSDGDDSEGWLYRKMTGQDNNPRRDGPGPDLSARPRGGRYYDPAVQQATALEPVSPGPTPEETLAAATGKSRVRLDVGKKKEEDSPFDPAGWIDGAYKSAKAWAGYGPNEEVARNSFEEGKELFRQRRYEDAAGKFAVAADRWPESALEEDSLFMMGESYFFADRYPKAHEAYETLLKKYTFSRHLDRAAAREFAIGRYWEQRYKVNPRWVVLPNLSDKEQPLFDSWGNAMKAYEHVRMNDPGGPLADHAVMATANANFVHGRYEEAARFYDMLRKDYPKSAHQMNAHLLALEAKQHVYQGPLYDGTPLKEANEVADQTLLRFGRQLGGERERVIDVKNNIVEELATRQWGIGHYYDKNAYYGAARVYYQAVIDEYPQSRAAEAARRRLDQIKDLPAEPPNRFKWLTYIFEPKKDRR